MNLIDVTQTFQNDDDCLAYLESMRWPDGIRCPVCGCDQISKITRKKTITRGPNKGQPTKNRRTRIYQCLEPTCKSQFSATNGTLFNDSHLPLTKWFMALAIVVDAKKGISAKQLQEHLGIGSYRTAWYMAHRIRKAMEENQPTKMSGIVEVDETYIGGKTIRRGKRIRAEQAMVVGLREREGRVRFFHVPDAKKATLKSIVDGNIATHVEEIHTDQAVVYPFARDVKFKRKHRSVNHKIHYVSPEGNHTNTIESAFSLLKRGLIGSFHRVSQKHLHRYLNEFEYRFNERKADDRFSKTLARMLVVNPMPYASLTE